MGSEDHGERMLKMYDHDGDGSVSQEEMEKGPKSKGQDDTLTTQQGAPVANDPLLQGCNFSYLDTQTK